MSMLSRLFESKSQKQQRRQADVELIEMRTRIPPVYYGNNSYFYQQPQAAKIAMELIIEGPSRDIPGLFVLGVAMEILERLPALPTSPYVRSFIHLIDFFHLQGDASFEEARGRSIAIKEQVESLDKVAAYIVSQGREAVQNDDSSCLARCYDAAKRYNLLNY